MKMALMSCFDFFYEGDDDELHTTTLAEGTIEEVCAKL